MSLTAPEGVKAALRRALDWIDEGKGGKGLEPATIQEAHRLADGDACTLAKARKALRFYARNARYPKLPGFKPGSEGYPSPARVSWDLWGGSDGPAFYRSVVRQLKPELLKRDTPGVWGDPLEELEEERLALLATVQGWLDPEGRELDGEPAEVVGDGEEESEWRDWVLPLFVTVTAKTLDVAADSAYALTWQQQRALIIRRINATTAAALEGADVPRRRVIFGLTPGNVATLTALEAELRKRGTSEEDIQARLRAESIALRLRRALLIAENETIAAHAGAVTAAWSEGLAMGILPAGTRRKWIANIFSLICPICAHLDGQIVGINEPFIGPDGSEYHAPGFHPRCRCKLRLVKGKTMSEPATRAAPPITTEEESAMLPTVLSEATIPPALAAGMGPVAKALLVATFNAYTAAGLGPYMALDAAKSALWAAGFWCNSDGTWTRPEKWEEQAHEEEEYRSPRGVMRAGKVLSAKTAARIKGACRGMEEHAAMLRSMLVECGYGEEAAEPAVVEESGTARVDMPVQIVRAASKTGDEFWGFANVSAINGDDTEDSHGTNFSVEELGRAMDKLAMNGRYLSLDHEHNGAKFAGRATQAMVVTPELLDYLTRAKKTGLLIKGRPLDEASRKAVLSGKVALSIAGRGRVV